MSAPERVWVCTNDILPRTAGQAHISCAPDGDATEYVRANMCDPTQDERVQALVEALHGEATHRLSGHPHRPDMPKVYAALRALEPSHNKGTKPNE